jgi:hypothetical protein
MAGNRKPRKARKPKGIPGALPITFGMLQESSTELNVTTHLCAEAFRVGLGDRQMAYTLANALNLGAILVRNYVEDAPKLIMAAGLEAIRRVLERGESGEWRFVGEELAAITEAIALSSQLQEMATRRELRDGIVEILKHAA